MCEEDEKWDLELTIGFVISLFVCVIIFATIGIYHADIQCFSEYDFKFRNETTWDEVPWQFRVFMAIQIQGFLNMIENIIFAEYVENKEILTQTYVKSMPFLIGMFASMCMMNEMFARTIRDSKLYLLLFPFCFSFFLLQFHIRWK